MITWYFIHKLNRENIYYEIYLYQGSLKYIWNFKTHLYYEYLNDMYNIQDKDFLKVSIKLRHNNIYISVFIGYIKINTLSVIFRKCYY